MSHDGARASTPMPGIVVAIISIAVALATLAAGVIAVVVSESRYDAEAKILISPVADSVESAASSADTLSRGTIVATFAQAYSSRQAVADAFARAGLPAADTDRVTVTSTVIAGTSIIRIDATSDDAALARRAALAMSEFAPELSGYSTAFRPVALEAPDAATDSGPSSTSLLIGALVLAILAGGLTAFVLRRTRGGSGPGEGPHERSRMPHDDEQVLEATPRR